MPSTPHSEPKWTVALEEDPATGDLLLPFPPDLLAQMGWAEGTELWWEVDDNKHIYITDKKEYVNEENTNNGSTGFGKNNTSE